MPRLASKLRYLHWPNCYRISAIMMDQRGNTLRLLSLEEFPSRAASQAISPFRYPGGKGFFSGFLGSRLKAYRPDKKLMLAEPFCGGAGASLNLLYEEQVSSLWLNDADIRIYSAWRAMLEESGRIICDIQKAKLTLSEWQKHRDFLLNCDCKEYSYDLGFSTLYLNRTTHSGIIDRAGPIGGYRQTGKWKIDARFNKLALTNKIQWIGSMRDKIKLSNEDGIKFISGLSRQTNFHDMFMFIDPPYVGAGDRLYKNSMNEAKHVILSEFLQDLSAKNWVLTYDDVPIIRELYKNCHLYNFVVSYSLRHKRKENEILALPA